ncbi:MAG: 16S rRNA (adenine(1518)-N(6)/adenine(1519)-N(6))-dimethyltransferase, partial [Acidimicrobiia bacterium]|nr:16S rRNA (adenine(1518)-N(6)/adenine(1519)-N(6))-dimethyltransferase [Acidimicrobiia bacterium]
MPELAQLKRLTRPMVGELIERHGVEPSRALGQNFLCEPGVVDKIVRLSGVSAGDNVIEIGPGLGSLTLGLADAGANVVAIEA